MKILIVEDSKSLVQSLKDGLAKLGYAVDAVMNGIDGLDYARFKEYDVIILDVMLPGMDGLTLLQKLRAAGKHPHVIILSARDQVEDRIRGLQMGADDYLIKPFSFDELCARISTMVRRKYDDKNPEITMGEIFINTAMRKVLRGNKPVELTPGEYAILEFLVYRRGRVVTVEQLLDAVYAGEEPPGTNVIQVMVCNLRKKLSPSKHNPMIHTRRGYGYYIE
jgi:DNA-binding response OmpR family regulator